jgi:hypothetical protein
LDWWQPICLHSLIAAPNRHFLKRTIFPEGYEICNLEQLTFVSCKSKRPTVTAKDTVVRFSEMDPVDSMARRTRLERRIPKRARLDLARQGLDKKVGKGKGKGGKGGKGIRDVGSPTPCICPAYKYDENSGDASPPPCECEEITEDLEFMLVIKAHTKCCRTFPFLKTN